MDTIVPAAPASGWWQVTVVDEPLLPDAHLVATLQAMLGCDPQTAARYTTTIRTGGQAVVRDGTAEDCKEISARLATWGLPVRLGPVEAS